MCVKFMISLGLGVWLCDAKHLDAFFSTVPSIHLCRGMFWFWHLVGIFIHAFQPEVPHHWGNCRRLGAKEVFLNKFDFTNSKYNLIELYIGTWQYLVSSNIPFIYVGIMFGSI